MKQFFEQYGAVALGILALLVLIAMITPVGNLVKTSLQGTVQTFSTSIESQHEDALNATSAMVTNIGNENGLRGDGKVYWNNQLLPAFSQYTFDEDGIIGHTTNGVDFKIYLDVNFIVNGTYLATGNNAYKFDLYLNNRLIEKNLTDYYKPISVSQNDEYKIVCKIWPDGKTPVQTEYNFNIYDLTYTDVFYDGSYGYTAVTRIEAEFN